MKFYGELLIFLLLFATNGRVFFVKSAKRDPLVALAPLCFILSIFQLFSWGVDFFTILGVLISFLVLLSNFHGLFRYTERLYVDHYSVLMKIWAIFTSLLSIGAIVCLIIFPTVELNSNKLNLEETKSRYIGTHKTGLEPAKSFHRVSAVLYEYKLKEDIPEYNEENSENKQKTVAEKESTDVNKQVENVILFVPDKRGDTYHYKPYLQLLAAEGYTVCSCDFFTDDIKWFHSILDSKLLRRFMMICSSLYDPRKFASDRELYTYNISRECELLFSMAKEKYGKDANIFIISDSMSNEGVSDFIKRNPEAVKGRFQLNSVPEYVSAGYGFIAETDSLLNKYLGYPEERNFKTPKLLVERTKEAIKF